HAPSLLGGDGGFPRTVEDVWDHADLDEVRRECRAQIERAILWGFDVSHLDAHMGTLQLRPEFFDVYLELALAFELPLRMVSTAMERYVGFPARAVAAEAGAVFTDHFRLVPGVGSRQTFERDLRSLRPGVTEFLLHPAVDSAELRSLATDDWQARVDDHRMICRENWVRPLLEENGATLIGYRPLRELARTGG
ncbi:MAG: ChbG/HpnK family deacetylase, partial [Acidimicrobiales bacterium]|nr:ChbG/HpnK family deacetylase [Acidimicrobiales bacterium]